MLAGCCTFIARGCLACRGAESYDFVGCSSLMAGEFACALLTGLRLINKRALDKKDAGPTIQRLRVHFEALRYTPNPIRPLDQWRSS